MPFVPYVQPSEYSQYGISDATSAQVNAACMVINNYLARPEGLLWSPDANGMPAFMTNLSPARSFALPAQVNPGSNVAIIIPNAQFGYPNIGEVVILDAATSNLAEACVVTATTGNTLTLSAVQFTHAAGATLDFGRTLLDELPVRPGSPVVRANRFPLAQILCGFSRYAFGKPPPQLTNARYGYEAFLLAETIGLSGPPAWTQLDTTQWDINYNTGAIMVLPYFLQTGLLEVRLRYVAGWALANLPADIKQAVANIVRSAIDMPFSSNMKLLKAGDSTMERFSPSVLDADTRALLQPYKLVRLG